LALAIILGLTYMATQAESCSKKKTGITIHANDLSADKESDEIIEDNGDDDEPLEEYDSSNGSISSDEDAEDSEVIPIDGTEPEYAEDETDSQSNSNSINNNNALSQTGRYFVIAGTFKSEANAKTEVLKLKDLGYPNAEKLKFDNSSFYAVCVARYENSNDAEKVANSIKNRLGKKAYVHKKRIK